MPPSHSRGMAVPVVTSTPTSALHSRMSSLSLASHCAFHAAARLVSHSSSPALAPLRACTWCFTSPPRWPFFTSSMTIQREGPLQARLPARARAPRPAAAANPARPCAASRPSATAMSSSFFCSSAFSSAWRSCSCARTCASRSPACASTCRRTSSSQRVLLVLELLALVAQRDCSARSCVFCACVVANCFCSGLRSCASLRASAGLARAPRSPPAAAARLQLLALLRALVGGGAFLLAHCPRAWLLAVSMPSSAWRAKPCSSENSCSHFGQVTRASGFRT